MKNFCLTIAGSDPISGAGIQADIRTFDRCGVHPFSVITAITYQSATEFLGYKSLSDTLDFQLDAIFSVYPIKYVKVGMIPDVKALDIIVDFIKRNDLFVVYDPVSRSSAGERLSSEGLELEIERILFPHVRVLTPNLSETEYYSNMSLENLEVENEGKLKEAAHTLLEKLYAGEKVKNEEKAVVIKSGLSTQNEIYDILSYNKKVESQFKLDFKIFKKKKISIKKNIHGTGCVFSSAIIAFLSKEYSLIKAIEMAEDFFDEKFQNFIELPDAGRLLDLTISEERFKVINQIKEVYNYISNIKKFTQLIPEVRLNISCSLPHAKNKSEVAGIEGRVTIVNNYPKASGEIKFGVSDHTARLILAAKKFDNSINFVMNLKYNPDWISLIQKNTTLKLREIKREKQPKQIKEQEFSTMQWLIKESINESGKTPDIIWDKGSIGKESMMRLFGKSSSDMIKKLKIILDTI
ncbi:MAG: bifunctional hydroxymethylpyrimidine kinase/phosphomethylpyrimidine kinase [Promethearchaeota archaeon]|jgi:hydroxymethylpyrimidine/phosphomethylpyrimidine kinase